ncbi:MAG: hypothetical protein EOO05_19395 [Chitinophagaceae bacterium]|nr:MAG: hypothetical protein EOO05_19395 [Chitinophagaceae bacterium]
MLLDRPIPFRYITRSIRSELALVLVIGVVVFYLTKYFRQSIPLMSISIPVFLGTAISVLLSFKLGQAYDRWWEARKVWGSIVNDSRTLVLQLQQFCQPGNETTIRRIGLRQAAWAYALGRSLRKLDPIVNFERLLSEDELQKLETAKHVPLALLRRHNEDLHQLHAQQQMETFHQIQVNSTVVRLTDSMGMAERINNTVFPVTYRIFLHFFIYVFVICLSIALRDVETYFEIPLLLVISSTFFLLEKSATLLQDPFRNLPTDTPVTSIANTIETNIRQLLDDEELPPAPVAQSYYIL